MNRKSKIYYFIHYFSTRTRILFIIHIKVCFNIRCRRGLSNDGGSDINMFEQPYFNRINTSANNIIFNTYKMCPL